MESSWANWMASGMSQVAMGVSLTEDGKGVGEAYVQDESALVPVSLSEVRHHP